jgi:uncharacterized ferredoxin-like protein
MALEGLRRRADCSSSPDELISFVQEALRRLGLGDLGVAVVSGRQKEELAKYMYQLAEELRDPSCKADAQEVRRAEAVLLLGLRDGGDVVGMNCGACGFRSCEDMLQGRVAGLLFPGPTCVLRALDLGVAVGLLAESKRVLTRDKKAMVRVGVAAKRMGLVKSDVVLGIPLARA